MENTKFDDPNIWVGHSTPSLTLDIRTFKRGWKAMEITYVENPNGLYEWFNMLWGLDVWYFNKIPLFKTLILFNILIWGLLLI